MFFSVVLSYLPYALVTSFTPGPNNILAFHTVGQKGWVQGRSTLAGIVAGFFSVMAVCGLLPAGAAAPRADPGAPLRRGPLSLLAGPPSAPEHPCKGCQSPVYLLERIFSPVCQRENYSVRHHHLYRLRPASRQRRPAPHTALCPHPLRHCGLPHLGGGRRAAAVLSVPAHPGVQRGHGRCAGPLRPGSSFLNRSPPIKSPMAFGQTEPQRPGRPLVRQRQAPYSRLPVPGKARAVCLTEPGSATESGHRAHWRKSHRPAPGQPR